MAGLRFESRSSHVPPEDIEDQLAQSDDFTRRQNLWTRNIRRRFRTHDRSQPNGRPHHIEAWLSGLLTGLGARRNSSKKNW